MGHVLSRVVLGYCTLMMSHGFGSCSCAVISGVDIWYFVLKTPAHRKDFAETRSCSNSRHDLGLVCVMRNPGDLPGVSPLHSGACFDRTLLHGTWTRTLAVMQYRIGLLTSVLLVALILLVWGLVHSCFGQKSYPDIDRSCVKAASAVRAYCMPTFL